MKKENITKAKGFALTLVFAISVMMLALGTLDLTKQNIAGKATYRPVQVYGEISPGLPDGTGISFKVEGREVASSIIENNTYGVKQKVYFKMDDPDTPKIEGYAKGDIVGVYIEGVHVVDFSYFEAWATEKNIDIPASKREEISINAERSEIERGCTPKWECDIWSECIDGVQTRNCEDIFRCGIDAGKPSVKKSCMVSAEIEQPLAQLIPWNLIFTILFSFLLIAFIVNVVKRTKQIKPKRKR